MFIDIYLTYTQIDIYTHIFSNIIGLDIYIDEYTYTNIKTTYTIQQIK